MRLNELSTTYHANIRTWVTQAKTLSVEQLKHILHDESERDPNWFIAHRESRLRQLVSEILTLALKEVSDQEWSEADFEGHTHSDMISQAINDVTRTIDPFYHELRTKVIAKELEQNNTEQPSVQPTEEPKTAEQSAQQIQEI